MLNPETREWILFGCLGLMTGAPFYLKNWLDRTQPVFAETVQKKTTALSFLIFAALFTGGFVFREQNSRMAGALLFAAIVSFSFLYQFAGRYQARMSRGAVASGASPRANLRQTAARFFVGSLLLLLFSKAQLLILVAPFLTPAFLRLQHSCTPLSDSELRSSIFDVFASESVPLSRIYLIDDSGSGQSNAFLAGSGLGVGPFGRTLFITLPLIRSLDDRELMAVILHEAAHSRRNHSFKRIVASVFLMVVAAFWVTLPVAFLAPSHPLAIAASILLAVYVHALLLSRVIARQEHEADLGAVRMGASSNALVSALRKLSPEKSSIRNPWFRVLSGNLYPTSEERIRCIGECEVPKEARPFRSPAHSIAYSLLVLGLLFWSAGSHVSPGLHQEPAKFSRSGETLAGR